ncbi:MAG TPA: beta-propeller fold lactonase family protein [Nitrospira sp.]|nr:beta-propeller fold lactonase family protein [Nitrospira sp.]
MPGYAEGVGAAGQTSAARFLYANELASGGPAAAVIQANGTLALGQGGSANDGDPMTMAIDPSGSFLYQTALGFAGSPGGVYAFAINKSNGSLGTAIGSYLTGESTYDDAVDNQGKLLFVYGAKGLHVFGIDSSGALTEASGSPMAIPAPSSFGSPQPANLLVVDQTDKYLYVSTSSGIEAFSINTGSAQLTPVAGSPFGTDVSGPQAIIVTPTNSYLYVRTAKGTGSIYGYSVDQSSGALTPLPGSPFNAGSCGTVISPGSIPAGPPVNMTIASAGKFMYDSCGVFSINESSGALAQVSGQGPGRWPVIDPTGQFLWAITSDQNACFSCDVGVQAFTVDPNSGAFTAVPNGYVSITDTEIGDVTSLAITK